ncbi:MAG: hypothetical protein V3T83_08650 [Acidobacteriota bacterium]
MRLENGNPETEARIRSLEPGTWNPEPAMPPRKAFLIRVSPEVRQGLQRWANDDLRSVNAQIEFLLRRALKDAGRFPSRKKASE